MYLTLEKSTGDNLVANTIVKPIQARFLLPFLLCSAKTLFPIRIHSMKFNCLTLFFDLYLFELYLMNISAAFHIFLHNCDGFSSQNPFHKLNSNRTSDERRKNLRLNNGASLVNEIECILIFYDIKIYLFRSNMNE